jgi:hypothetical protein
MSEANHARVRRYRVFSKIEKLVTVSVILTKTGIN